MDEEFDKEFDGFIEFDRTAEEFDFEFDSISGRGATTQRITAVTRIFTGSVDGILSNSAHLIGTHGK